MADAVRATGRRTAGSRAGRVAPFADAPVYLVAIALAAVVLVPIAYVVLSGFRTTGQIAAKPVGLPHPWVIHNYAQVITSGAFWRQVGNSTIVAAIATALVVGVSALAAYPLSRLQFRGREAIYTFFTFGLLFPVAVAALPLYLLLRQLGLARSSSVSRSRRLHSGFRSRSSSCGRSCEASRSSSRTRLPWTAAGD